MSAFYGGGKETAKQRESLLAMIKRCLVLLHVLFLSFLVNRSHLSIYVTATGCASTTSIPTGRFKDMLNRMRTCCLKVVKIASDLMIFFFFVNLLQTYLPAPLAEMEEQPVTL